MTLSFAFKDAILNKIVCLEPFDTKIIFILERI